MAYDTLFRAKAPQIMRDLMKDFGLSVDDAAAICGNLGHESGGFKFLQEITPVVPGSRGGYGWAQWTGPRRRAFEAWCREKGLAPASDAANYGFLCHELRTTEASAIPKTKAAVGLRGKVVAFEAAFERAGVKHYDSREKWARIALDAYAGKRKPPPAGTAAGGAVVIGTGAVAAQAGLSWPWTIGLSVIAAIAIATIIYLVARRKEP